MFDKMMKWSLENFKDLPWRKNRQIYYTLVSEVMLQQTTVGTVKNHFGRFIEKFPNLESLANAKEEEVLIAWKGLGYYRRAKNLHKMSLEIMSKFRGKIPDKIEQLIKIPGIGPYTANAIVTIGYNKSGLPLDANIERVLARFYGINEPNKLKLHRELFRLFEEKKILSQSQISPRSLFEGLMDVGRVYCQLKKTNCVECPLNKNCRDAFKHQYEKIVVPLKKKEEQHVLELMRIIVIDNSKILAYQKLENEWLAGQWELPTFLIKSSDISLKQYPNLKYKEKFEPTISITSGITKYKMINHVVRISYSEFSKLSNDKKYRWLSKKDQEKLSALSLKIINRVKV